MQKMLNRCFTYIFSSDVAYIFWHSRALTVLKLNCYIAHGSIKNMPHVNFLNAIKNFKTKLHISSLHFNVLFINIATEFRHVVLIFAAC